MVDFSVIAIIVGSVVAGLLTATAGLLTTRAAKKSKDSQAEVEKAVIDLAQKRSDETKARDRYFNDYFQLYANRFLSPQARTPKGQESKLKELEQALKKFQENVARDKSQAQDTEYQLIEKLFRSYHQQALQQSTIQFWFSVGASVVGFGLIIGLAVTSERTVVDVVMRSVPGAIIEAVSALFFSQARETRKKATDLFDKLRLDKNQERALEIVSAIEDKNTKAAIQAQIAMHLAGLKTDILDLSKYQGLLKQPTATN